MKLYAQMYSVKEDCAVDFKNALKTMADYGYDGIELVDTYGLTIEELKLYLNDLGLEVVSAHVGLEKLENDLENQINGLKTLGAKYIVCPWSDIHTTKEAMVLAAKLNIIGKTCYQNGLTLLYHNHDHELVKEKDQYLLDVLFDHMDDDYVQQQVDVYWLAYAGVDVEKYLMRHKDRIKMVHLKQIESLLTKKNVAAQDGIIDFKDIMEWLPEAVFVYEQEHSDESIMVDMGRSFAAIMN